MYHILYCLPFYSSQAHFHSMPMAALRETLVSLKKEKEKGKKKRCHVYSSLPLQLPVRCYLGPSQLRMNKEAAVGHF